MLNLDTHILLYALSGDLTSKELKALSGNSWGISCIVLWEIEKLYSLDRVNLDLTNAEVKKIVSKLQIWPITSDVIQAMRKLDFKSDPADEIIAATSIAFDVPLVTRDKKILKSRVTPFYS